MAGETMTVVAFLTSPMFGCGTTKELLALSKMYKDDVETLKVWAKEEMANRGIQIQAVKP